MSTELNQPIAEYKVRILSLLAEYKHLTARQIWDKSGAAFENKSFKQTQMELNRLKKAGLVKVERGKREKGQAGEYQWLLLQAGAHVIGFANFSRHYRRTPTRNQTQYQRLELETAEQVELALGGWQLLRPLAYGAHRRLPDRTPQFHRLCQAVTWQVYRESGELPENVYGPQSLIVPRQANHHLAYLDNNRKMVVLILTRPRATERFWQERAKQYRRLATKIQILGVFPDKKQLELHEKLFFKAGLKGITVVQVSNLLSNFYEST